jgi:GT2 family glycosyltransferase
VLVILNSASDNDSQEVCLEFQQKQAGRFRFLREPRRGKSRALNLGIQEAHAELLAMIDDDVLCAPDFVASIRHVFDRYPADAAQGRVFLDCEGGLPEWMSARHCVSMSQMDFGDDVRQPFNHTLFGSNFVVRAAATRAVGGFALELGPGSKAGLADDTEFSIRLEKAGYRLMYAPQIVVRHQLPRERLTRSFFRKRNFSVGRSQAYYMALPEVPLWRYGLFVVKNLIVREMQALRQRLAKRPAQALDSQCEAREQAGFFWQHLQFWLGVPRQLTLVTAWSDQNATEGEKARV